MTSLGGQRAGHHATHGPRVTSPVVTVTFREVGGVTPGKWTSTAPTTSTESKSVGSKHPRSLDRQRHFTTRPRRPPHIRPSTPARPPHQRPHRGSHRLLDPGGNTREPRSRVGRTQRRQRNRVHRGPTSPAAPGRQLKPHQGLTGPPHRGRSANGSSRCATRRAGADRQSGLRQTCRGSRCNADRFVHDDLRLIRAAAPL